MGLGIVVAIQFSSGKILSQCSIKRISSHASAAQTMNVIDLEILIPASPEFIWRFLGDLAALPRWQEDVASVSFLSTQREGRGARWRASSDNNSDVVVEVSAWYDTLGYEYSVMDGMSFAENQGRVRLHEVTDGTLVRWTFQYELKGIFGGLRNAMRIKRGATNQIQASLRNLHQLILQESGGISTHEAKASVQEAPDVDERSAYQPRHPSSFHDPALEDMAVGEIDTDTDKLESVYDFDIASPQAQAAVDSDTKPNPVVIGAEFEMESVAEPDVVLDDTKPVELEALFAESNLPPSEPVSPPAADSELRPAATPEPPLPPASDIRDRSELSVFEIFGLQKPSEARKQAFPFQETYSEIEGPRETSADLAPQAESQFDDRDLFASPAAAAESPSGSIMGLRRRARRRSTKLRSHT